jgi:hypothetical protein
MNIRFVFGLLGLLACTAHAQVPPFNRFTEDLPQLLETDAATVMARGVTYDFAGRLCARLGNQTGEDAQKQVTEWRRRNDAFFRGASSVLNEFGDRHLPTGGEGSRQAYFQMIMRTAAGSANQRVMREFNGASLDNGVIPPDGACAGLTRYLRDGVADFERTPTVTRALLPYMQRKGIQ